MTVRRIGSLLAIGLVLTTLAAALVPHPAEARAGAVAQIDLGGLFGDENEPDENESDEGGGGQASQDSGTSGVSVPIVLVLVALAAIAGAYAALRVRRLWLRLQGWGHDMRARL